MLNPKITEVQTGSPERICGEGKDLQDGLYTEFELSAGDFSVRLRGSEKWVEGKIESLTPVLKGIEISRKDSRPIGSVNSPASLEETVIEVNGISDEAIRLLRKEGIDPDSLHNVFCIEDENVELIISDLPGGTKKQKTVNLYLLRGFTEFLKTGTPSFCDTTARELCQTYGVYDSGNHAITMKGLQGKMIGSKTDGFRLTVPGMNEALKIVKSAISSED
jgi:hypothetical protein